MFCYFSPLNNPWQPNSESSIFLWANNENNKYWGHLKVVRWKSSGRVPAGERLQSEPKQPKKGIRVWWALSGGERLEVACSGMKRYSKTKPDQCKWRAVHKSDNGISTSLWIFYKEGLIRRRWKRTCVTASHFLFDTRLFWGQSFLPCSAKSTRECVGLPRDDANLLSLGIVCVNFRAQRSAFSIY